jgi:hypothetical protein
VQFHNIAQSTLQGLKMMYIKWPPTLRTQLPVLEVAPYFSGQCEGAAARILEQSRKKLYSLEGWPNVRRAFVETERIIPGTLHRAMGNVKTLAEDYFRNGGDHLSDIIFNR